MIPWKLSITFDNKKEYTIHLYKAVGGSENWMAYSDDVMGSGGPGKSWMEALQNCIHSISDITAGNVPVPTQQELEKYRRHAARHRAERIELEADMRRK